MIGMKVQTTQSWYWRYHIFKQPSCWKVGSSKSVSLVYEREEKGVEMKRVLGLKSEGW